MGLLASVLAFVCFLAGSIVMVSGVGPDGSIGFLDQNLPATTFGVLGFLVLVGTVFASRKKAR